ncbi:MAG: hypothetical protein JWR33_1360 [Naasia sp.]|jgi:hypothetical protein|uniref:hypothetical protein n=1 Tax=Naasia sp. TaxID=2546198 RepID=UPI002633CBAE|nr:hypothetical protein [Naasia sp.]MCU1570619.1 hypothetical protein [Naasia sp.]
MAYIADKPTPPPSADELRARIPGWGADVDPKDRPAFPRERRDLDSGAHWNFPDRQPEIVPRERSIEHKFVTPVFGTAQPLAGLSGAIRRYAYARFSEGRAAHWLLLLAGDRVDAMESHARSLLTLHPDNPVTETGILSEFRRHPIRSRFGRNRADLSHTWLDPILVAGPWLLGGWVAVKVLRRLRGPR